MNIIPITDFNAPELDIYARATENQLLNRCTPDKGIFIAESPKVVERALNSGCMPVSVLIEDKHIKNDPFVLSILERIGDIPIFTSSFDVLTNLTGFQLTRGMLCAMYRPKLPSYTQLCKDSRRIAILENIMNPTNIGAIFRNAAALGLDAILLTPDCSNPLYRRAIRVSMGTVFQIPWTYIDNATDVEMLGFKTAAMALCDDSVAINSPELKALDRLAIILGSEGDGLKEDTIQKCNYTVRIPMAHGVDSLNVAAASAIAFFELTN